MTHLQHAPTHTDLLITAARAAFTVLTAVAFTIGLLIARRLDRRDGAK